MKSCKIVITVAVVLALFSMLPPSTALAQEVPKAQLRLFGGVMRPTGEAVAADPPFSATASAGNKAGFGGSFEYRVHRHGGIELAVMYAEPETAVDIRGPELTRAFRGDVRVVPVTAGFNVHVTPGRIVDVYFGPAAGIGFVGDIALAAADGEILPPADAKNRFVWGAVAGVDIRPGRSGWGLTAAVRYLDVAFEEDGLPDGVFDVVDINPIVVTLGVSFAF